MVAKEWKRRINIAYQAKLNGEPGLLDELCAEFEVMTEPPPVPPIVMEIPAGKMLVMPPQPPPFPFHG